MAGMTARLVLAGFVLMGATGALSTCSTTAVGTVVLNDCPMNEHDFADNSTLIINFVDFSVALPTTTLTTRAFQFEGQATHIPMGIIRIPKGVNCTVIFRNKATIPSNLHTHGLHIQGGQNPDGTTSDDVSVEVAGGTEQIYNYYIPGDHAGGTHWIHSHVHMMTEIQVLGGALGMLIVDDDARGFEVPEEILDAPSFELIMGHFVPNRFNNARNRAGYSMTPAITNSFYTTNGFSNPILGIKQGMWTRLRMLHASPSDPLYLMYPGSATANCTLLVLAKDGVYLPSGPRLIAPGNTLYWTQASRVDILVKCDGTVGSTLQFRTNYASAPGPVPGGPPNPATDLNVFKVRIDSRSIGESSDTWFPGFIPCMPDYLADTTTLSSDQVIPTTFQLRGPPADTLNGNQFSTFLPSSAIFNLTVGTVREITVDGVNHPLHIHVNHMQYQADSVNGWHKKGDFVDVAIGTVPPFPLLRSRIDQHIGMVVLHCHITGHEDAGLMGVMYAYPDASKPPLNGVRPEEIWGSSGNQCNVQVKLAGVQGVTMSPTTSGASETLGISRLWLSSVLVSATIAMSTFLY